MILNILSLIFTSGENFMKRFKNDHYPFKREKKSQKRYTKECIKVQAQKHLEFMKKIPSDFDYVKPIALQLVVSVKFHHTLQGLRGNEKIQ